MQTGQNPSAKISIFFINFPPYGQFGNNGHISTPVSWQDLLTANSIQIDGSHTVRKEIAL
jgi:hypothetical protein